MSLYDFEIDDLIGFVRGLGQPDYRGRQLAEWLYRHFASDVEAMVNLPAALRRALAVARPIAILTPEREIATDNGDTIKTLYRTADGQFVETVLMLYRDRATVCVSCQVGCAVGCAFCATGLMGLNRNLTAGEMVQQVVDAARRARDLGRPLTNLVMMGMGEPLHNYAATMQFIRIINDPRGMHFGARRITISTSGIVPKIDALAEEPVQVNLAISIHAPTDDLRTTLMPVNLRYPIADLMAAIDRYIAKTGRRVSFEYALMGGINDSAEVAGKLAALLKGRLCHVNLIPYNPVDVLPFTRSTPEDISRFAEILEAAGIPTTVRYSRGVEIAAACGQLRAKHKDAARSA